MPGHSRRGPAWKFKDEARSSGLLRKQTESTQEAPTRSHAPAAHGNRDLQRHGKWYVGYVPEIPGVNAQERSLRMARASLKTALRELALISPRQLHGTRRQVERLQISLVA